jgi:hypothetical protein
MGHLRNRPAERDVDLSLAGGIGEVVDAADHVGHAHVVVVDDDGEIVGRRTVGAQDDEVVEILVLDHDAALDEIVDHRFAAVGGAKPDGIGPVLRGFGGIAVAPRALVAQRATFGEGAGANGLEFLRRAVAAVGIAGGNQGLDNRAVAVGAGILRYRLALPVEAEPGQPVEDGRDRRLGGTRPVGVLDAQQHRAIPALREQPVEQRRARAPDVEEAGGGRGKAGDDSRQGQPP